ncbi:MAG: hypothetical protein WBC85_00640 [Planktotalea sp.]|uniref:hypothetical protein n=1 Tax=Planktotalea sp. TaxID=2029877 RepID=UPI003C72CD20
MDVILHIGAHRTASTSFQTYVRQNRRSLAGQAIGFWGPARLRKGLFHGVIPNPLLGQGDIAFARAQGRIGLHLDRSGACGISQLIVSDENMLGTMRQNIATRQLYPCAGERVARHIAAFRGAVKMIHISMRDLGSYWPSALSFCIPRGVMVPTPERSNALAEQRRDWRDVITDVAIAAPDVPIFVSTYEQFGSRPHQLMSYLIGRPAPALGNQVWRNRRPAASELLRQPLSMREQAILTAKIYNDRWEPFSPSQCAALQERYADDLFWLRSGSDGLATFLEDPTPLETRHPAQMGFVNKGQTYDTRQRLARPG